MLKASSKFIKFQKSNQKTKQKPNEIPNSFPSSFLGFELFLSPNPFKIPYPNPSKPSGFPSRQSGFPPSPRVNP